MTICMIWTVCSRLLFKLTKKEANCNHLYESWFTAFARLARESNPRSLTTVARRVRSEELSRIRRPPERLDTRELMVTSMLMISVPAPRASKTCMPLHQTSSPRILREERMESDLVYIARRSKGNDDLSEHCNLTRRQPEIKIWFRDEVR